MEQSPTAVAEAHARVRQTWDDHHERLWRAVLAWSGDAEVASDAVAEAFAQAIRRGDAVEHVDRWVWRAAFRIAAGMLQARPTSLPPEDRVDEATLPDDTAALRDALGHLSDDDRRIVVLSLVGGWSSDHVAEISGSTAGAVRVRLHRAKKRLRAQLEVHDG